MPTDTTTIDTMTTGQLVGFWVVLGVFTLTLLQISLPQD